jgi:hypothetical protein
MRPQPSVNLFLAIGDERRINALTQKLAESRFGCVGFAVVNRKRSWHDRYTKRDFRSELPSRIAVAAFGTPDFVKKITKSTIRLASLNRRSISAGWLPLT